MRLQFGWCGRPMPATLVCISASICARPCVQCTTSAETRNRSGASTVASGSFRRRPASMVASVADSTLMTGAAGKRTRKSLVHLPPWSPSSSRLSSLARGCQGSRAGSAASTFPRRAHRTAWAGSKSTLRPEGTTDSRPATPGPAGAMRKLRRARGLRPV